MDNGPASCTFKGQRSVVAKGALWVASVPWNLAFLDGQSNMRAPG